MPTPAKLHSYRGQMLSAKAIAAIRGLEESTIRWRIRHGIDLDAPNHGGKPMDESGEFPIGSSADTLYWEDDLEARVWHMYCGGDNFGECSLQEIASLWGVSRQRVQQIETTAIRKIRARAKRGCADAVACQRLLKERIEAASRQRPGHWEWMELQAPGNMDLTLWGETHSHTMIAAMSQRNDVNRALATAARRGGRAMRGRTRRKEPA